MFKLALLSPCQDETVHVWARALPRGHWRAADVSRSTAAFFKSAGLAPRDASVAPPLQNLESC